MIVTSVPPGTLTAVGLFLAVGVAVPALLVWRDIRREQRRLASPVGPADTADFSGYLGVVSRRLGFVPEQNEEICAEIEAHLYDTSDALVLDGMDPASAKRRAMDQLGSPADLAAALRTARRDRPPVLATVGGGAIEAGKGLVVGYLLGALLLFIVASIVVLAFGLLETAGVIASDDAVSGLGRDVGIVGAVCVALAIGSQRGVLAVARASRRSVAGVGRVWALGGATVVAWLAIFVVEDDMSWLEVIGRLLVPVAVAVGSLRAERPWLPISRSQLAAVIAGLVGVLAVAAVVAAPRQAPYTSEPWGLEVLPPLAPAGSIPSEIDGRHAGLSMWCDEDGGHASCVVNPGQGTLRMPATWRDLRLEAWPATTEGNWAASGVDPAARHPTIVVPVEADRMRAVAEVDIGERRDGPGWWLVLTGLHADGVRYRLTDGDGVVIPFVGTVADWLTAPG